MVGLYFTNLLTRLAPHLTMPPQRPPEAPRGPLWGRPIQKSRASWFGDGTVTMSDGVDRDALPG